MDSQYLGLYTVLHQVQGFAAMPRLTVQATFRAVVRYRQKTIKTVVFIAATGCLINNAPAVLANTCHFRQQRKFPP
jgi:hypothetical protein